MADFDIQDLLKQMLAAAAGSLKEDWPAARRYAEMEFVKFAQTIAGIEAGFAAGEITKTEARLLINIQRNAMRSVLLTIEGLGILAVEKAINAALKVVRDTVNGAIGFALL